MGLPPFRPSRHGFPFANEYDYSGHQLGRGAPVAATFGLGAGLCWAALDRYLAGRRIARPQEAPQAGDPLYLEMVQRQANAIMRMGWEKALRWQRLPDEGSGSAAGLSEMTRVEWRWVRRSLDAGTPILLFLIRASGAFESPFENQFVLAYRYEVDRRAGRLAIWVYDPNRPDNDEVRLTLAGGPRRAPLQAHLALKDEVRGFFAVPYDREVPPSLGVEEARLANGGGALVLKGVPALRLGHGGRLEVVARGPEHELVVATRDARGTWHTGEVDRRGGLAPELRPAGSPVLAPRGPLRAFARSQSGELVEYSPRAFSGWRARSITAQSGGAHGYGVDSDPVVLATPASLSLFARHGGDAVHFQLRRGRWHAENLSVRAKLPEGHNLVGELVATRGPDGTRHVFGRTQEGHLVHFRWRHDHGWAAQCVTTNLERFGIAGDPVALELPQERAVHVLARSAAGLPLDFRWSADSGWRVRAVDDEAVVASSLCASVGPDGTMHAVARSSGGELLHFWSRGELAWRARDVTSSNGALGEAYRIDGEPRLAIGPGEWLHVLARSGEDVLVYRWSPDADWTAESLAHDRGRAAPLATEPVVLCAADGAVHALGVDASGTPVYVQAGVEDAPSRRALASTWLAFGYAVLDLLALPGTVLGRMAGERRRRKNRGKSIRAAMAAMGGTGASAASAADRHASAAPRPRSAAGVADRYAPATARPRPTTAYEPPAPTAALPADPFAAEPLPRGWGTVPAADAAPVPDPYAAEPLPRGWGTAPAADAAPVPDPYAAASLPDGRTTVPVADPAPVPDPYAAEPLAGASGTASAANAAEVPDPYATNSLPEGWGMAGTPSSGELPPEPVLPGLQPISPVAEAPDPYASILPSEWGAPPALPAAEPVGTTPPPAGAQELEEALRLAATLAEAVPAAEPAPVDRALELPPLVLPELSSALPAEPAAPSPSASELEAKAPGGDVERMLDRWERPAETPPIVLEVASPEPGEQPLAEEVVFVEDALEATAPANDVPVEEPMAPVQESVQAEVQDEVGAEWDREPVPESSDDAPEEPPSPIVAGVAAEYAGPWAPVEESAVPAQEELAPVEMLAEAPGVEVELLEAEAPEPAPEAEPEVIEALAPEAQPEVEAELVDAHARDLQHEPEPEAEPEPDAALELIEAEVEEVEEVEVEPIEAQAEPESIEARSPDGDMEVEQEEAEPELIEAEAPDLATDLEWEETELILAEASDVEMEAEPNVAEPALIEMQPQAQPIAAEASGDVAAELTLPASFGTTSSGSQLELLALVAPRRMPYPIPIDPVRPRPPRRQQVTLFSFDEEEPAPAASAPVQEPEAPRAAPELRLVGELKLVAEEEPLAPAVASAAAPLFDLDQMERPFSIAPQPAAAVESHSMDLTLPGSVDVPEDAAHVEAELPALPVELGGTVHSARSSAPEADLPQRAPLPPAADPLIATIDGIIAEAYRKRDADAQKAGTTPGVGFPQIPALPDYLILAPEKEGDADAAGDSATPPAPRPSGKSPAGPRPQVRRGEATSDRIAALQGLPLLEPLPLDPNAQPLPELELPTAPAVPVSRLKALQNAPATRDTTLPQTPENVPAPTSPEEATSPGPERAFVSEREAVLAGLPLLEPLDDVGGGSASD